MNNLIKIITVDDHPIINQGIKNSLKDNSSIIILENFTSPFDALKFMQDNEVNVVISDLSFGEKMGLDGIGFTSNIKEQYPDTKVIIYTGNDNLETIRGAYSVGASGYVSKEEHSNELMKAIQTVITDTNYSSQNIFKKLVKNQDEVLNVPEILKKITGREKEVLIMVAKEFSTNEISEKLFISIDTVNSHKLKLRQKLNVKSDVGLANFVFKHGLI